MNKLAIFLGSSALLAALVVAGVASAQGTYATAPFFASLIREQDGTCRGQIKYGIALNDTDISNEVGVEVGILETKSQCSRLTTLAASEVFDTKGGKLTFQVMGARIAVLPEDPDGAGPRVAGECDLIVHAESRVVDTEIKKVFRRGREVVRVKRDADCSMLTSQVNNSCWWRKDQWPVDVPFPSVTQCP